MLHRTFIIILLAIAHTSYSQNAWIFATHEDLVNNNAISANLKITTYSNGNAKQRGALLYTFEGMDEKQNDEIKHLYFAVTFNDSLYINCEPFTDEPYYANVIMNNRKYMYFISLPSKRNYINKKDNAGNATVVVLAGTVFGAVGGLVAYAALGGFNKENYPDMKLANSYLYNISAKNVNEITPNFLTDILSISPELQKMYIGTGSPSANEVYHYYISRLLDMY